MFNQLSHKIKTICWVVLLVAMETNAVTSLLFDYLVSCIFLGELIFSASPSQRGQEDATFGPFFRYLKQLFTSYTVWWKSAFSRNRLSSVFTVLFGHDEYHTRGNIRTPLSDHTYCKVSSFPPLIVYLSKRLQYSCFWRLR